MGRIREVGEKIKIYAHVERQPERQPEAVDQSAEEELQMKRLRFTEQELQKGLAALILKKEEK